MKCRFHNMAGIEYAALTLDPLLCSKLTDKNFINHLSWRQGTNRLWNPMCASIREIWQLEIFFFQWKHQGVERGNKYSLFVA